MNNKKIQANMQINVGFIADTTKLVKQVETDMKQINLGSSLADNISTSLDKNFRDIGTNLEKMMTSIGKRGLSLKQYQNFFNTFNDNVQRSVKNVKGLADELTKIYNSKENQEYLNNLKEQQKTLEKIEKLGSKARAATTRANTNVKKASEYGIDLNNSATTKMLDEIIARRGNNQGLTPGQQRSNFGKLNEEELKKVITLYKQENEQLQKRKDYIKEMQQLSGSRSKEIEEIVTDMQQEIIKTKDLALTQEEYNAIIERYINLSNQLEKELNTLPSKMETATDIGWSSATREAEAGRTLSEIAAQFGFVGSIASNVARTIRNLISYSFDFYKDLDSALNEIYVVSGLTAEAVNKLTGNFINMAKETGMSIDDVTRAAVLFYQQGLNTDEVMQMTEVTAQFAKVAGTDATDAADKLTAAVNGYRLSAEDAMSVADKFNKVAAASAADIDELSTAFSKAAAQANQAGVSMDNYLAYIATMEEATREAPENLGTSLKTIFSRMQQIKTGNNEEDGVDVNQVETALRSVGIALRDASGQLRDLEEIFDELGPKWNNLSRNTQAYLGTIIAGTRQQSRFITLMQNWDRVLELSEESANSAGQQALMHAKAMDSIESKLQQLTVAWQEFVSNLSNSKVFKVAIDGLTKLINLINSGNQPVSLMVAGVSAIVTTIGQAGFGTIGTKIKEFFQPLGAFLSGKVPVEGTRELVQLQSELSGLEKILADVNIDAKTYNDTLAIYSQRLDQVAKAQQKVDMQTLAAKAQAAGAIMLGVGVAVGNVDQNLGGLISTVGSLSMAFGMLATNRVGAIITGLVAIYQGIKLVTEWSDNLKKRMTDAIEKVSQKMNELSNKITELREINRLKDSYDTLSKKIYRTTEEQEKLNDTIQKMSDLTGIETYTDDLGNLHMDLTEIDNYIAELETKRNKLKEELRKEELSGAHDATNGFMNDNSIDDYYRQLFASNRSQYRGLLQGIDDKLKTEERAIGSNAAKTFNDSFKKSLIKEIEHNKYTYLSKGFAQGMEDLENEINSKLSKEEWNQLYTELSYLQNNIDNLSFTDVQDSVNQFYNNWSARTKLAEDEWNVLKNSIINTVFENSSMIEFFDRIDDMMDRAGLDHDANSYYSKQLEAIQKQRQAISDKVGAQDYGILGGAMAAGAAVGTAIAPGIGTAIGAGVGAVGTLVQYTFFPTEEQKKYKNLQKAKDELAKQEREYLKELQKEHPAFLQSEEDAKRWILAQYNMKEAIANTTGETQKFLSTVTSLYDVSTFEDMTAEQAEQYGEYIKKQIPSAIGGSNDAQRTNILIDLLLEGIEDQEPEVREKIQKVIDEAFNNLQLPSGMTFTQIGNELDSISEDLRSMNKLIGEFNEQGYLTLDQYMDLAKILDSINIDNLGTLGNAPDGISYIDHYISALKELNLAYDQNTGAFIANGEALMNLQTIQEIATKTKIQAMINELKAAKANYQAQLDYIDIQIQANQDAIDIMNDLAGQSITATDLQDKVTTRAQKNFNQKMIDRNKDYKTDLNNLNTWTIGVLNYVDVATQAWARYWEAVAGNGGEEGVQSLYDKAVESSKNIKWEAYKTLNVDKYGGVIDPDEQKDLKQRLADENAKLEKLKVKYQALVDSANIEIQMLEKMRDSDLSKLGADVDTGNIEKYIGQLKEIYNILNRIQMLEHRLSMLDAYADVATEKEYGDLLQERLSYNAELLDQYRFLTDERKKQTNGYKEFIQSVEGLEGVFDFDKYGQIIINWEQYMALQDEAINGETTMKEKADDVYETYTKMLQEVQDYLSTTIDYYKAVIKLGDEIVDSYVTMQDKAAKAVKEIYQQILDTKLDAIDQEKEAIDELRKARERANKEQKDSKEVAGIQSDIQRAMMDTSGASDSALIKSQSKLDEKLDAIAEDKYSEMLDNIIARLDEEKESLQREFDDMFDDLTWLFSWLDTSVMEDFGSLESILTQTQDWREKSELERMQTLSDWKTKFESYYDKVLNDAKGVYAIYDTVEEMKKNIKSALDDGAINQTAQKTAEIWQTLESWKNGNSSNVNVTNAAAIRSNANWNGYINANPTSGNGNPNNPTGGNGGTGGSTAKIESTAGTTNEAYRHFIGAGKVVEIRPDDDTKNVRFYNDDKTSYVKQKGWVDPNVAITDIGIDDNGEYYAKVSGWDKAGSGWIKIKDLQYTGWFGKGDETVFGTRLQKFASGGLAKQTGLAWIDGSFNKPEAVLDALQTKHFIDFTNTLDKMYNQPGGMNNSIVIDTISFNVESMSSPEDGEKAFNMFVSKFNEIGNQTGIKFNNFKNTL